MEPRLTSTPEPGTSGHTGPPNSEVPQPLCRFSPFLGDPSSGQGFFRLFCPQTTVENHSEKQAWTSYSLVWRKGKDVVHMRGRRRGRRGRRGSAWQCVHLPTPMACDPHPRGQIQAVEWRGHLHSRSRQKPRSRISTGNTWQVPSNGIKCRHFMKWKSACWPYPDFLLRVPGGTGLAD